MIIFDISGTLLDPGAIDRALGTEPRVGVAALDDAITQAMTDALAREYRPFSVYLEAALKRRRA